MTGPQTFDGGIDEQDRDQTEEALAVAIAGLLAGHAASTAWLDLVQASLTGVITHYLQRASMDMAISAGLSGADAARASSDAVNGVLGDVERHTASWLASAAKDRAPKGGKPMDTANAEEAAQLIATSIATYARERAREGIAKGLGAQYKRWTTRGDAAVRETHRQLAGQTKRMEKPFTVNGMEIMRPGDPEAALELTIRCRCWCIYLTNPAA